MAVDSIWNCEASPAFFIKSFITNSAMGLRQMLPWQINRIFFIPIFLRKLIILYIIAGILIFAKSNFRMYQHLSSMVNPASMMATFCVQFRRIATASNSGVSPYIR